ncbi:NAD(P)/FAD-dependent oxidoreductase [Paenibacillus glycanilyticus]|uniref:NAD(P)/FAD-dependent oxidoreductase n=1 Tax=Paenibacillus glycanilyticus TaxID=126569 RepID=UPI00203C08D8|nr:NAD(P)/FAD-dependent oxidoreductase [Paenibacillus glycanilyticus]MCM3627636.1 NAD(P)/FAD-dependent oxidoreductase [Paenibacillus glycanilyticus]
MNRYEITIIGAGVSGIFAAHELAASGKSVIMLDKGKKLNERSDSYIGFGGLGMSEGKYNYTNDFGGELERKTGYDAALQLMDDVDAILCRYGGSEAGMYHTYDPELSAKAQEAGFGVLTTRTRHLGTRLSKAVLQKMYDYLETCMTMKFEAEPERIEKTDNGRFEIELPDGTVIDTNRIIIATGRSGNEWFSRQCDELGIGRGEARVDLGLRVEMRGNQLNSILKNAFETKLSFAGKGYTATTYCMNPRGRVVLKLQEGLAMPDGQNYREKEEGSSNLNFTLFVPNRFPTLEEADAYFRDIVSRINRNRNRIAAQRLGSLRQGMKEETGSEESGSRMRSVLPTLEAEFTDLREEVPERYLEATLAFLEALEKLLGESIDEDTIVYAIDGKLYSPAIETSQEFETKVSGLFVIGDCSGTTHSLSQAAASGVYVGRLLAGHLLAGN